MEGIISGTSTFISRKYSDIQKSCIWDHWTVKIKMPTWIYLHSLLTPCLDSIPMYKNLPQVLTPPLPVPVTFKSHQGANAIVTPPTHVVPHPKPMVRLLRLGVSLFFSFSDMVRSIHYSEVGLCHLCLTRSTLLSNSATIISEQQYFN